MYLHRSIYIYSMPMLVPVGLQECLPSFFLFCDTQKEKVQTILYLHIRRYRYNFLCFHFLSIS